MAAENDLGRDNIKKLVIRIAVPSMLAQFVSVLYSIVDRMYIGNIPVSGDMALAGAGVCGPVVTMIGSVAFVVGIGGAPLMSMKMGQGDNKAAERILANCFLMLALCSVLMVACIYPIRIPMLRYFGASDTTLPYANAYFTIYLTGTVFALMSTGMNQFIICQGFAKTGMYSVIIGAVLNIVLDPVFIFGFHMGVSGAATATVLSQTASCAFVLKTLFGKTVPVRITFGGYDWRLIRRILTIGFTPFIIIAMDNVMIITMNAILQKYGGAARGDRAELHAGRHYASRGHHERNPGGPRLQFRSRKHRPRKRCPEIYLYPGSGVHHLAVYPRTHRRRPVRPSLYIRSDGCR